MRLTIPKALEAPTIDGKPLAIQAANEPQNVKVREHEAQWSGQLTAGGWKITTRAEMDYDGYVLYRLRLEPKGRQKVDAMRLVIPLRPEEATHLHAAGGVWMRGAVSSIALPRKAGRLWSSLNTGSPDIRALRVGSFKPYVWVGGAHRGLAFMADSDEGWANDGQQFYVGENRRNYIGGHGSAPFPLNDREDWNLNATHKVPWERKMSYTGNGTDVTITTDIKDHNYRLLRVTYAQE